MCSAALSTVAREEIKLYSRREIHDRKISTGDKCKEGGAANGFRKDWKCMFLKRFSARGSFLEDFRKRN